MCKILVLYMWPFKLILLKHDHKYFKESYGSQIKISWELGCTDLKYFEEVLKFYWLSQPCQFDMIVDSAATYSLIQGISVVESRLNTLIRIYAFPYD